MKDKDKLKRRGIEAVPLQPKKDGYFEAVIDGERVAMRKVPPEKARELSESCPTFRVRTTGIERDGTPFDVVTKIRAPYKETAINMVTVRAIISYGCRVDSAEVISMEGMEWPREEE